jgi:hypothetical protein
MKLFGTLFFVILILGLVGPTVLGATEKPELRQHDNIVLSSNASSQSLADRKMVELSAEDRMKMKKLKREALEKLNERGGSGWLDSPGHSLSGAWRVADYAAVSRVVRLSEYTWSGVWPSSA